MRSVWHVIGGFAIRRGVKLCETFKQFGGFIDEGFVDGIKSGMPDVNKATEGLTSGFKIPSDYVVNTQIRAPHLSTLAQSGAGSFEFSKEQAPVHVVVNVGEEKLVDKIINGINDRSFLSNQNIINI